MDVPEANQITAYVSTQLRLRRVTMVALAHRAGVTKQTVAKVIAGDTASRRVQQLVAKTIGHDSWEELCDAAAVWYAHELIMIEQRRKIAGVQESA